MARCWPILGYPSVIAAVTALRSEGLTTREIAGEIGQQPSSVLAMEYRQYHAKRPRQLVLDPRTILKLQPAAQARGITVMALAGQLLDTIVRDQIIDAVLDDGGQL